MTDKNRMIVHLITAMILLPGTVVLLIPGIFVWIYGIDPPAVGEARLWLAKPLLPGGLVRAGETLLGIEPADYTLAVRQLAGEVAEAEAALKLEQGNRDVALREYELLG